MMRALQAALPEAIGRALPVDVTGPIPAILLGLSWPLAALKGIGLLCRTAGLVAHCTEEAERPIGFILCGAAAIEYDGGTFERESSQQHWQIGWLCLGARNRHGVCSRVIHGHFHSEGLSLRLGNA